MDEFEKGLKRRIVDVVDRNTESNDRRIKLLHWARVYMTKLRVVALLMPVLAVTPHAADLSGVWTLDLDPDFSGNQDSVACGILQEGTKLSLNCGGGAPIVGEVADQSVTWRIMVGPKNQFTAPYRGTLDKAPVDDVMNGKIDEMVDALRMASRQEMLSD